MCNKRVILLLSLFLVGPAVYAQQGWGTTKPKENPVFLSAYAETGLSISSYHTTDEGMNPNLSSVAGFNIGAGVNMRFVKRDERSSIEDGLLGIQAGFLYTNSGFKTGDEKVSGGYLCIPVDFQFYPIPGLFIEAGPELCMSFGFTPETVNVQDMSLNISGHKANDLKFAVGAGYIFNVFPAGIHIKYLFGTSDFAENLPWKGNQLRISLFYRLGF